MSTKNDAQKPNLYGRGKPTDPEVALGEMRIVGDKLADYVAKTDQIIDAQSLGENEWQLIAESDKRSSALELMATRKRSQALRNRGRMDNDAEVVVSDYLKERSPFISAGAPFAILRVPPYEYAWTSETIIVQGFEGPTVITEANVDGNMKFELNSNAARHATRAHAATGVGIYFRPFTNGPANVYASAQLHFRKYAWVAAKFAEVYNTGFIGMWVGAFRVSDGTFAGTPVDFTERMWQLTGGVIVDPGWSYTRTVGATFPVDSDHYYHIWILTGGYIRATGDKYLSTSDAHCFLISSVPLINWTYMP